MTRYKTIAFVLSAMMLLPAALAAPSAQQDYLDAARLVPNAAHGAQVFGSCAVCHGAQGGGSADGRVPRIAGQHQKVIIRQLVDYRYEKRWDPVMEHMADQFLLPDAQAISDVAGFLATLEVTVQAGIGPATYLSAGRQTYLARCSSCHGSAGQGNEKALVPRLAGQHYAYLLRQLHDAIDGRRPQLASSHGAMLKDLDRDALQGMADLLSRF